MAKNQYILFLTLLFIIFNNVGAVDVYPAAKRFDKKIVFVEKERSSISISTESIVQGFMGTNSHAIEKNFFFILPKTKKEKLCVSLTTSSGTFYALAEVSLDGIVNGAYWSPLNISNENFEKLKSLPNDNVALQIKIGDSCLPGDESLFIPVSWFELLNTSEISIFLNSNRTNARIALEGTNEKAFELISCQRILTKTSLVTFDTLCKVPMNKLSEAQAIYVDLSYLGKRQHLEVLNFEAN